MLGGDGVRKVAAVGVGRCLVRGQEGTVSNVPGHYLHKA